MPTVASRADRKNERRPMRFSASFWLLLVLVVTSVLLVVARLLALARLGVDLNSTFELRMNIILFSASLGSVVASSVLVFTQLVSRRAISAVIVGLCVSLVVAFAISAGSLKETVLAWGKSDLERAAHEISAQRDFSDPEPVKKTPFAPVGPLSVTEIFQWRNGTAFFQVSNTSDARSVFRGWVHAPEGHIDLYPLASGWNAQRIDDHWWFVTAWVS